MSEFGTASLSNQPTPERPWLGLSAYTEASRDYFFGRKRETAELLRRLGDPLTVLYGRSGLGKSSLLGAGLIPALRSSGAKPVLWRFDLNSAISLVAQLHAQFVVQDRGEPRLQRPCAIP